MPEPRLQWHLLKCRDYAKARKDGMPIFYCKYYRLHIYFDEEQLREHEKDCDQAIYTAHLRTARTNRDVYEEKYKKGEDGFGKGALREEEEKINTWSTGQPWGTEEEEKEDPWKVLRPWVFENEEVKEHFEKPI